MIISDMSSYDELSMDAMEKRRKKRATLNIDIFYPHVNNKRESENKNPNEPVIRTINISETGICFLSRVEMKKGDFVSFLIRIEDNPSFECFGEVKWVETKEENYIIGAQFYTLSDHHLRVIREYVDRLEAEEDIE